MKKKLLKFAFCYLALFCLFASCGEEQTLVVDELQPRLEVSNSFSFPSQSLPDEILALGLEHIVVQARVLDEKSNEVQPATTLNLTKAGDYELGLNQVAIGTNLIEIGVYYQEESTATALVKQQTDAPLLLVAQFNWVVIFLETNADLPIKISSENAEEIENFDKSFSIGVLAPQLAEAQNADGDKDGVANNSDNCPFEANANQRDIESDGLGDVCDPDDDNDGIIDVIDNCRSVLNETQADLDNDGQGDTCDIDDDGDDIIDSIDNCPLLSNNDQVDGNGNGVGNACEGDDDGDGAADSSDNCLEIPNADQFDNDGDFAGDVCDDDDDNDDVLDVIDNCPLVSDQNQDDTDLDGQGNPCDTDDDSDGLNDTADLCPLFACDKNDPDCDDQADTNGNKIGDACEDDIDGDGILNSADNCPANSNADQKDTNNDKQGDACDDDDDSDGEKDSSDNCPAVSNANQKDSDGDGQGDACDLSLDCNSNIPAANCACQSNSQCDDGDRCNGISFCDKSSFPYQCKNISGTSINPNDSNLCTNDSCEPATGTVTNQPNANSCNDGNACSQTDTCSQSACVGANPVVCVASDQCHDIGVCDTSDGTCSNPNKSNGSTCDDGNLCTLTDTCESGICVGTNPVICTASDQCHDIGVCDTTKGICSNPNQPEATSCNDNNSCSQTDLCQSGACLGTNPVVCVASDQCHDIGVCDTSDGTCSNPNKNNGSTCDDGNPCTLTDTCESGICVGTNPFICTASDQCHDIGVCNTTTGDCSNPNKSNGTNCNDENLCTQIDSCQDGACQGTQPVVCTTSDQCHTIGICDTASGACSDPNKPDGVSCIDGNACTLTDSCQNGTCLGSNPVVCEASDQCHVAGICNTANGACSNPNKADNTSCTDGNACTQTDSCQSGACVGASPVLCTASDQCHVAGTCNTATGECSDPNKPDGVVCSDGNACTLTDSCQSGFCAGSNPKTCSALDQCHKTGSCDINTGFCSNPNQDNGLSCSDDNLCTQADSCQNGTCVGASPIVCSAQDSCHDVGTCNTATGECSDPNKANGTTCLDATVCNGSETCQSGTCTQGSALNCDDSLACTTDTCNTVSGCQNTLKANRCLISSTCFNKNDLNPANECEVCDSTNQTTEWTDLPDDSPCSAGVCTSGQCS